MSDLVLYHFPGACSNVCVVALEQAGLEYELRLIDLSRGEQTGEAYLKTVPLGKVPALHGADGMVTENAAILTYIHGLAPDVGLFPASDMPIDMARRQAGLSFCGGNLHPIVRGLANPSRLTDGDGEPVRSKARTLAKKSFGFADQLLSRNGWWLGEWSIIDVYLDWAVSVARNAGYDVAAFPALDGLRQRLMSYPAYARTQAINDRATQDLAARGAA